MMFNIILVSQNNDVDIIIMMSLITVFINDIHGAHVL